MDIINKKNRKLNKLQEKQSILICLGNTIEVKFLEKCRYIIEFVKYHQYDQN